MSWSPTTSSWRWTARTCDRRLWKSAGSSLSKLLSRKTKAVRDGIQLSEAITGDGAAIFRTSKASSRSASARGTDRRSRNRSREQHLHRSRELHLLRENGIKRGEASSNLWVETPSRGAEMR